MVPPFLPCDRVIARLEAAAVGCRELDRAIHIEIHGKWMNVRNMVDDGEGWIDPEYGKVAPAQSYTTSLDAALTLVPAGMRVRELGQWWDVSRPGGWFCQILNWEYASDGGLVERAYGHGVPIDDVRMPPTAPTAALALCIAALRARQTGGVE